MNAEQLADARRNANHWAGSTKSLLAVDLRRCLEHIESQDTDLAQYELAMQARLDVIDQQQAEIKRLSEDRENLAGKLNSAHAQIIQYDEMAARYVLECDAQLAAKELQAMCSGPEEEISND